LAGSKPKQIKILDVESGQIVRELSGHGRGINDLAISPLSTDYLVSCAEDGTIRIWNLSPEYEEQPCVALLGGGGHKQPILAIHFHPSGRWLLSGGIDTAVALWAVPPIEELEDRRKTTNDPLIVYDPHFFSDEVHSNYVDSLAFYGDLIISRAASDPKIRKTINEILIWKIDGFESDDPAPLEPAIPIVGKNTLSSFPHEEGFRGFRRIATLSMPSTERFYQRFGLFHKPGKRPLLAMGNHVSRFYFFDLQKLEEGTDIREFKGKAKRGGSRGGRAAYRGTAAAISSTTTTTSRSSEDVHMTGTRK
jgi:polycomb protein EED